MLMLVESVGIYIAANLILFGTMLLIDRMFKHNLNHSRITPYIVAYCALFFIPAFILDIFNGEKREWRTVYHYSGEYMPSEFMHTFEKYEKMDWRIKYGDGLYFQVKSTFDECQSIKKMLRSKE